MWAIIIFAVLFVTLFLVAYLSKRRFGILGLALCAGSLLSNSWANSLTPYLEKQGVHLIAPPLLAVVSGALLLAPAFILMLRSPSYHVSIQRFVGSLLFTVLAFVFLLDSIKLALPHLMGIARFVSSQATYFSSLIIAVSIVLALLDIVLTKNPPANSKHSAK